MTFDVRFSASAEDDLTRLFGFLLDRAKTIEDLELAQEAIDAVRSAVMQRLAVTPYSFRKSGRSPIRRELIIPFGNTGYVALFEIVDSSTVIMGAIRHQREDDYH